MKKKFIYILLIAFFFSISAFVVIRYSINQVKLKNATYPLIERKDTKGVAAEWQQTKEAAEKLINTVHSNPKDIKAAIALSSLYIQEARITGNYVYYDAAAMKYISSVLEDQPENFEALNVKSFALYVAASFC